MWLVNPTPGHLYNLSLFYERPDCVETRSILFETTEYTGCRIEEVAYGILTETMTPTKITETITFRNSNNTRTSRNYLFGIESYRWVNVRYALGWPHWTTYENNYIWADYSGTASLVVTYTANLPVQTFEYKTKDQGGDPYIKAYFYLYGSFWIRTSDFSKYNVGDWCLVQKRGTTHPIAGDPFVIYGSWDRYDSERNLWVKEIRRYYSSVPYDVLFTSENVQRIRPPSDALIIIPRY